MQDDRIHVIKVSLMHDKTIYRKIAIRGDQTLKDLPVVIVIKGESPPQFQFIFRFAENSRVDYCIID